MMLSNFNDDFKRNVENADVDGARNTIIRELGRLLADNKQDFVNLLKESGVNASMQNSELELIDLYINNLPNNKKLMLGTSLLVQQKNQKLSADGTSQISDSNVKVGYEVMKSCFNSEQYSNAVDPVSAIAEAVGKGADLSSVIVKNRERKKYGAQDLAAKKAEAKAGLMQSVLDYKKAKAESSKKTNNTPMILAISAVAVVGIIIAIVFVKRRNK